MKKIFTAFFLFITVHAFSQSKDELAIRKALQTQTECWNRGDINGFMKTYWQNDSLMFIGKTGVKWGWQTTLDNYKRNYPDTTAMGKLFFDIIVIKRLSPDYYFVVGRFYLKRSIGDLSGHYDLLFRKLNGKWLIISDHTS